MADSVLDKKRERAELVKLELKKHNRPIWKKIGILTIIVVLMLVVLVKFRLPTRVEIGVVIILGILVLWLKVLLESLKTTFEFDTLLPDDVSITDKKWFLYLVPGLTVCLLFAIFICRLWTSFIKPQMILWGVAIVAGLIVSSVALWWLYRYERGLQYETLEVRMKLVAVYYVGAWFSGIFITSMFVFIYLNQQQGVPAVSVIKVSGNEYELYYEGEWYDVKNNMWLHLKLEPGDSASFEVVKKYPFLLFRNIREKEMDK